MFVLMYEVKYEGQQVFGVYATLADAIAAAEGFDPFGMVIRRWELGAPAAWYEGELVWEAGDE